MTRILTLVLALGLFAAGANAAEKSPHQKLVDRLNLCGQVLDQIMAKKDTAIPATVLQKAKGIIILNQYRAGFIFGGQGGSGVLIVRNPQSGQWSVPGFVISGAASIGLQIGAKEVNTIFLLMSEDAVQKAYSGRFNIGVDASAVAGPVGTETESFDLFKAPVLVYSSSQGLFAGAAIKGGWISQDEKANHLFYHTTYSTPEILLSTWFKMPPAAQPLINRLNAYENR